MKIAVPSPSRRALRRAFTLAEMMVVVGLTTVVGGALVLCYLLGLSLAARQQFYMDATGDSVRTLGKLMNDVHGAQIVYVGNYINNSFVPNPDGTNQWGDAIRLYFGTSTNVQNWVDYYLTGAKTNLMRSNYLAGSSGNLLQVSANPITNDYRIFTLEDSFGNVMTNLSARPVVNVYLAYLKSQNAALTLGTTNFSNLYSIRARLYPR